MRRARECALALLLATLALGLVGVGAGACSLTSDFDGIVGVRPLADAADEATVDSSDEAGNDAGARDANVNCESGTHLLCRDFDEGVLTQGGFVIETTEAGTAQLDATQFVSPPGSFRSKIPAAPARIGGILFQTIHVGTYKALRFGFDARIASCGGKGSTTLAALQISTASAFGLVFVDKSSNFAQVLLDTKGLFLPHALPDLPIGRWFRFEVRLELSATVANGVVTVDGKTVLTDTFEARIPAENVIVNLGTNATGPVNACDVGYDNVTLDKE